MDSVSSINNVMGMNMKRRNFLAGVTVLPLLPLLAHASDGKLRIGIFPGTGTSDMLREDLRAATRSFARVIAGAVGREPLLTMFTTLKSINRSLEEGRLDVYFAPPTVAVTALGKGYVPIARVKDNINVMLVRRKGAKVESVALVEKESLPDVLGRYVLKGKNENVKIFNLKAQEDVILAMERNYAQAGSLGAKLAKALVEKGKYEAWHPLPASPGFTLVASKQVSEGDRKKLQTAVSTINPAVIGEMQKVFVAKIGGFVADDGSQLKTLKQAMASAGYL